MISTILYINACVRPESRTNRLAQGLLSTLGAYEELNLSSLNLSPLDNPTLSLRSVLISQGTYDDPMFHLAKQFASAEIIVIAAPFWDMSFPAVLKIYLENIYVTGIVSQYGPDGMPRGLCKAQKLYYVTTAGGPYDSSYSYDYIKTLSTQYFGIRETALIKAELLDVDGFDAEKIIQDAIAALSAQ